MIQTSPRPAGRRRLRLTKAKNTNPGSAAAARERHRLAKQEAPKHRRAVRRAEILSPIPEPIGDMTRRERKAQLREWAIGREVERQQEEFAKIVKRGIPANIVRRRFGALTAKVPA